MINSGSLQTNYQKPAYGANQTAKTPLSQSLPAQNPIVQTSSGSLPQRTKLSIFYINDMHGNIDNMAGMVAASDKFDKETENSGTDTLKISAGDNFSGADKKKNQVVVNLLSRMGIDVSAVGNHEFDSTLSTFYEYLHPDKTKFLAANAIAPEGSDFYNNVQKSTVIEVNGHKYGLIGLLPFDLAVTQANNDTLLEGIRPEDIDKSIETVNEEAEKLTQQGIDKIILVSHIGNDNDRMIAPKLHNVDVIVGGHSHTEVKGIEENQNLYNNADGDPILIVQTGENAKNVGILNVEFDDEGVVVSAENNLVKVRREKSPALNYIKNSSMGESPKIGTVEECDPLPDNRRITPCAWTNLLCDAMKNETGSDIAFINASNTRKTPQRGSLTERDVSESTPNKNTLLVKQMTEKEVVRAIKDALSASFSNETGEPGILHTSGLSYSADTNGNLHELNFVDKNGNTTPIDIENPSDKVYRVCYDSFVAAGTEYPVFVPKNMTYPEIEQQFDFNKDKLAIDYISKLPNKDNLVIKDDERIKIFDKNGQRITAVDNQEDTSSIKENDAHLSSSGQISDNKISVQNTSLKSGLDSFSPLLKSQIKLRSNAAIENYGSIS